uniref:Uncharacterized protein n=1 Tax=Arundo donax TaxID=35708 RepID=A0A0A9HMQ4_ARUDO
MRPRPRVLQITIHHKS